MDPDFYKHKVWGVRRVRVNTVAARCGVGATFGSRFVGLQVGVRLLSTRVKADDRSHPRLKSRSRVMIEGRVRVILGPSSESGFGLDLGLELVL